MRSRTRLERWLPASRWLRSYDRKDLARDGVAGLTVAVMLVPQSMAYAMLAGLPPQVGLYASVLPLIVYAFFGTSRQLAVGPVAMVSMLTAASVGALAEPGDGRYVALAVGLAGLVGAIQLLLGLARLGGLAALLSHPVISGFTSAAAILIGLSQLKHLIGAPIPRSSMLHETLGHIWSHAGEANLPTLAMSAVSLAVLVGFRRWAPRLPAALIVVVLATGVTSLGALDGWGIAIVGSIPAGLPSLVLPALGFDELTTLAPTAFAIALVGFVESFSVAKGMARTRGYRIEPNQELVGLGLANLASVVTGGYPVTGGFSRTAVNARAGGRTPLASIITAVLVAVTLAFMTPLFHFLPNAVLGAIVLVAVGGLVDLAELKHLWRVKRSDALALGLTFGTTLSVGIEAGIGVGVAVSIGLLLRRSAKPHTAVLGRMPGTTLYRNVARHETAREIEGVRVFRFDASVHFANADGFRAQVERLLLPGEHGLTQAVVLDAGGINDIDSSGAEALRDVLRGCQERGVELFLGQTKGPVRDVLRRSTGFEGVRVFSDLHQAVEAARLHATSHPIPTR